MGKKKEFFCDNDLIEYANTALVVEFWHSRNIFSISKVREVFKTAIKAPAVTLLKVGLHKFFPIRGIFFALLNAVRGIIPLDVSSNILSVKHKIALLKTNYFNLEIRFAALAISK